MFVSHFASAGLSSFQPSSWARPWQRGWKPPYCLLQRRANHKITPKLSVKSSSMLLTQRYTFSYLASSSSSSSSRTWAECTCHCEGAWLRKNFNKAFLSPSLTNEVKQMPAEHRRWEGRGRKCVFCHIFFFSHAVKCHGSRARFNHWSVEQCSS